MSALDAHPADNDRLPRDRATPAVHRTRRDIGVHSGEQDISQVVSLAGRENGIERVRPTFTPAFNPGQDIDHRATSLNLPCLQVPCEVGVWSFPELHTEPRDVDHDGGISRASTVYDHRHSLRREEQPETKGSKMLQHSTTRKARLAVSLAVSASLLFFSVPPAVGAETDLGVETETFPSDAATITVVTQPNAATEAELAPVTSTEDATIPRAASPLSAAELKEIGASQDNAEIAKITAMASPEQHVQTLLNFDTKSVDAAVLLDALPGEDAQFSPNASADDSNAILSGVYTCSYTDSPKGTYYHTSTAFYWCGAGSWSGGPLIGWSAFSNGYGNNALVGPSSTNWVLCSAHTYCTVTPAGISLGYVRLY